MKAIEATMGYRLSKWASVLKAWKESGLNIKRYCNSVGIFEHQYYYWQKKLREAVCEKMEGSRPTMTCLSSSSFMEVNISPLQLAFRQ
jgi:hypothetical protein